VSRNTTTQKIRRDEAGFAAIIIAIVLVLVLSLLTIGFAELMRKETRSALDKHLSSQAYYAAESGVNDAARAINAGFNVAKQTCDHTSTPSQPGDSFLDSSTVGNASDGTGYTCLLIDPAPPTLEFSAVDTDDSKSFIMTGVDPANPTSQVLIKDLNISWDDANGGTSFVPGASHKFNPAASWPYAPVLRVSLTPLASGGISRNGLIANTVNTFLYPNASGASVTTPDQFPTYIDGSDLRLGTDSGEIIDGNCNANSEPRKCNVRISGLNQSNFLVSLRSVYAKSRVTITATGYDGQQLRIRNAQTLVDSTGKAQDVLRRIQVRIPSHNSYDTASFGLDSMAGICKQLQLTPTTGAEGCTP
jgi:hypothetical protein